MFLGARRYQDPKDEGCPPNERTTFILRPLSVGDMVAVEGSERESGSPKMGDRIAKAIEKGIENWENFLYVNEKDGVVTEIAFSPSHISWIPADVRANIANEVFKISILPDSMREELVDATRTSYLRSDAKGDTKNTWDCDNCIGTPLQGRRRCPLLKEGEKPTGVLNPEHKNIVSFPHDLKKVAGGQKPRFLLYGGHPYERCPVGGVSDLAWSLFNLVMNCLAKNIMPVDPPVLLHQPFLFYQAMHTVEAERAKIEKNKEEEAKAKSTRAKKPPSRRKLSLGKKR